MSERDVNRAVVLDIAGATSSRTRDGEPTVTVRATFGVPGYTSTEQLHLSYRAALLLRDHLNTILP